MSRSKTAYSALWKNIRTMESWYFIAMYCTVFTLLYCLLPGWHLRGIERYFLLQIVTVILFSSLACVMCEYCQLMLVLPNNLTYYTTHWWVILFCHLRKNNNLVCLRLLLHTAVQVISSVEIVIFGTLLVVVTLTLPEQWWFNCKNSKDPTFYFISFHLHPWAI